MCGAMLVFATNSVTLASLGEWYRGLETDSRVGTTATIQIARLILIVSVSI